MTDSNWIALGSIAGLITAIGTAVMAIAIVGTAVYARDTLASAKADSRARTRPTLAAYLERELLSHGTVLFSVKNFGPSSAFDVQITFDPPAPVATDLSALPNTELMKWVYQRFSEPVPSWPPGWSTSNVIRSGEDQLNPFAACVTYRGSDGTRYSELFKINPDNVLKETTSTPSKTDSPVELAQQGVSALQALVRTLRAR